MREDNQQRPERHTTDGTLHEDADSSAEALREILLGPDRQRMAQLNTQVEDLTRRITDEEALIAMLTPVIGEVIRRKIRDARDEMVETFYPIIGRVVLRAVAEAISDLARSVDARVRTSFSPRVVWWRLRARMGGVPESELALRQVLPFEVAEVFLIHRETGLLLWHVSRDPDYSSDTDLIGSMLTAIRDFVQEAFGQGTEGHLEEIEYGDRRILIEAAQHAYVAVVVDGTEPPGFWADMRECIIAVEHTYRDALLSYDGDPTPFASVDPMLRSLMTTSAPHELSAGQRVVYAGLFLLMVFSIVAACVVTGRVRQRMVTAPPPLPLAIAPTLTPTLTPSPRPTSTVTPSSTATPAPSPTVTPTPTATATPAPLMGRMTGNVWLHDGPSGDSPRTGVIAELEQPVEILDQSGNWYEVRWVDERQGTMTGWVPARWVVITTPVPPGPATPVPGP